MASIELPRALQDYFAFAETAPTRAGRRFSITMPYLGPDGRLERLQWWYHLSAAKEKALGDKALQTLRGLAIERFRIHIDRWLQNTAQVLYGDGPIPKLAVGDSPIAELAVQAHLPPGAAEAASQGAVTEPQSEPVRRPEGKAAFG
ncbi:MAG: hypothetical protein ACREVV_16055 [Steroidobacteraceae bacterium]